jgi:hypothetical protein
MVPRRSEENWNDTASESDPVARRGVGVPNKSDDVGELVPEDPAEQRTVPGSRSVGGNDERVTELARHLNET